MVFIQIFILFFSQIIFINCAYDYSISPQILSFNRHRRPLNCNKIIDQKVQWLLSPNYPSDYDENLNCFYTIQKFSTDVCQVELVFADFNLEFSSNCVKDYFLLNNGVKLCGFIASDSKYLLTFPHGQNDLQLQFVSNIKNNKKGFVAIFNQLKNSCVDSKHNSTGLIYANTKTDSLDLVNECNKKFYSFEGILKSPNFPSFYPTNIFCRYLFKKPNEQVCKIKFKLKTFDLNNYPSRYDKLNCDNGDYLEISETSNRLCGLKLEEELILNYKEATDYLTAYFYSDSIGVASGFEIEFEQIPNSCSRNPLSKNLCDLKLKDENRLTSPNYPNNYEPNTQCVYEISQLNSSYCEFSLMFRHFNLELSVDQLGKCNKDFLELPNGDRICGSSLPYERSFKFNYDKKQYLIFTSNNEKEESGFDIQINQIACQSSINKVSTINSIEKSSVYCDQIITSKYMTISSLNFPDNYIPSSNCQYSIYKFSDNVCQIRMHFIDFDLNLSNQCQNDYFYFMENDKRYCGKELKSTIKVLDFRNSDVLRFRFITDSSRPKKSGFKIEIEQLENSCRLPKELNFFEEKFLSPVKEKTNNFIKVCGVYSKEEIKLESPNYPLTYPSNTNCLYRISKTNYKVDSLEIIFIDFSVGTAKDNFCLNDYLEINGERYCGLIKNQRLLIKFPDNLQIINFRFRSDETDNHLGFKLFIRQIYSKNQISSEKNLSSLVNDNQNFYKNFSNFYSNFNPNLVHKLMISNDANCMPKFFNQKNFYLTSPGYRYRNYPYSIKCSYWIQKKNYNVCALQLTFDEFHLEQSQNCEKDFLQIQNLKLCGFISNQTKKTLDFSEDQMVIIFNSDFQKNHIGFHISIEQIEC